jgi:AraC family transcriptional regulator of adaptative response/methylated-DNA-[protein]-cysteine methyltransferase
MFPASHRWKGRPGQSESLSLSTPVQPLGRGQPEKISADPDTGKSQTTVASTGLLLELSAEVGLSSGSRLYDHFVKLEAVTPGEYKSAGAGMRIDYGTHDSPFGTVFVAVTRRGICRVAFLDNDNVQQELQYLLENWPDAHLVKNHSVTGNAVEHIFSPKPDTDKPLSLPVSGTNFQVNVWKALLNIRPGQLATYSQVAQTMGMKKAARAVGSAIASNPIALLIPCHRVIRKNGQVGEYHWGTTRKHAMIAWESAQRDESL